MDILKRNWDILSDYVKKTLSGRDDSHGYNHLERVAKTSLKFLEEMYGINEHNIQFILDVLYVAFLHDICDHKYNNIDLENSLRDFLSENVKDPVFILNVIDRISFSKEDYCIKNNIPLDWNEILGDYGIKIRDLVSDADKIEAIGKIGIERCIEYSKSKYFEKNKKEITQQELIEQVKKHSEEKLLRLKDEFIKTMPGKKMAEPLHEEMVILLRKIDK